MLDVMRRHSQSYLVWLFFGIIIIVFVFFFGPQSDGCQAGRSQTVAEVGDRKITSIQLEQLFARVDDAERGLPPEQRTPPGQRRRQLAEDLVLTHVLAEEARAAGMAVSDEQFSEYIQDSSRNPDYGNYTNRDGLFDSERYNRNIPGVFGLSVGEYEAWKEDELLATQLLGLAGDSIVVTRGEVEALHRVRNTQYELEFVRLAADELTNLMAVSDAQVSEFLAANEERVRGHYEANVAEYEQPRTLRVRRIFIRLPGESDAEGRAEAISRYETALQRVTENPDSFADAARELSDSSDRDEGGDMGLKPAEDYASFPFMAEHLETVEVGAIQTYESQVSRTIFRVEEDNPARVPPFEEVRDQVARGLLETEQGDAPLRELAQWFHAQAQAGTTLEDAALQHARDAAAQRPQESPPAEGTGEAVAEGTGEAEPEPEGTGDGTGDSAAADPEPIVQVRRTGLFSLDEPPIDLGQFGPQFAGQMSPGREPDTIPRIGEAPELAADLSALTLESPVAPQVYELEGDFVVARLVGLEPASETIEPAAYDELRSAIWRDKAQSLLGAWQVRLLLHRPVPLSPLLQRRLEQAVESGDATFEDSYFAEPEIVEEPVE